MTIDLSVLTSQVSHPVKRTMRNEVYVKIAKNRKIFIFTLFDKALTSDILFVLTFWGLVQTRIHSGRSGPLVQ